MEVRVLRYFLTVAREGNITRAAEILHMTQPTLSRQLAQLEDELNAQLLIRGKRHITLTEEGMRLRRRAEEIVELADRTEQEFALPHEVLSGNISIGSGEASCSEVLAELILSFRELHPMVSFDLYSGNADLLKERLDKGLIDIALLMEPVDVVRYDYLRLNHEEKWGALMRADDPRAQSAFISRDELVTAPLMLSRRLLVQQEIASWLGAEADTLQVVSTHNLIANAARLVERGMGLAITVEGAVSLYDPKRFCFRPIHPPMITRSVMVWKKYQSFNPATTAFLEHIRRSLQAGEEKE